MRRYLILIRDPRTRTREVVRQFSTLDSRGRYVPGALNVEFDIPVTGYGTPTSGAFVRVWGIPLDDIAQSSDYNNFLIEVYGGMSAGLPLSNPGQFGLLCRGHISQCFGNWIGTSQSLDFIVLPDDGPIASQVSGPFTIAYKANENMLETIRWALQAKYPDYTIDMSQASPYLNLPQNVEGVYYNVASFAQFLNTMSKQIAPTTETGYPYSGLVVFFDDKTIRVVDNSRTATLAPVEIQFQDLIGQPTWSSPVSFQFNTVLRGDLTLNRRVILPPAIFQTSAGSLSQFRDRSAFTGEAVIMGGDAAIRHVGNYRAAQAQGWITTVNCVVKTQ